MDQTVKEKTAIQNEKETESPVPEYVLPETNSTFVRKITDQLVDRAIEFADPSVVTSGTLIAREILETIVAGTEHNIALKANYDIKCRSHNQYGLFKLLDIMNDFEINEKIYNQIAFRECLIISTLELDEEDGQIHYSTNPVGGICIDVQKAEGQQPSERIMEEYEEKLLQLLDEEGICHHTGGCDDIPRPYLASEDDLNLQNDYGYSKFVVHSSSQFDVDGKNGGSTITSWVDRNCHTVEELRKEFITDGDNVDEKTLYSALKHRWYYIKHTSSTESTDDRKLYSIQKARDFVSEGANFILMRYLAIQRYLGKFELSCAYINGDLCKNIYQCFGPESDIVHGQRVDCCRIKRTIIEECGLKHKSITVLSLYGRILKHEWDGCNYVMIISPQIKIKNATPSCIDEINLEKSWMNDIQMLSTFLDLKHKTFLESRTYDADHPELRQLMADYVNQIMRLRPPDIKSFTFNYFGSFVSTHLPRNDYFE